MKDLLTDDGCLMLHGDPSMSHYVKIMLDEVFGRESYVNEIIWRYRRWPVKGSNFQWMHDVIFRYLKTPGRARWNQLYEPLAPSTLKTFGNKKQVAKFADGKRTVSETTEEVSLGAAMSDVWEIGIVAPIAKERTGYPTQKPEALLERIITACSCEGDTVLDPYMGSGTTVVVAKRLGRRGVGIDSGELAVRVTTERLGIST